MSILQYKVYQIITAELQLNGVQEGNADAIAAFHFKDEAEEYGALMTTKYNGLSFPVVKESASNVNVQEFVNAWVKAEEEE